MLLIAYFRRVITIMQLTNREIFQHHLATPSILKSPIEIVSSKGIYLYADDNKEYIDLVSGVSVSNVGHLHPKVVRAINDQLGKYMHLMVYGKYVQSPQVKLAEALCNYLPTELDSVYMVNSGSEAIEGALKLAKRVTGKSDIISFNNSYHGSTHGALSILGNETMKSSYGPLLPGVTFCEFNSDDAIDAITQNTAAIILETVQAEAGVILPKPSWLKKIRDKCDSTGTMLIFDEIQVGFGRTGKLMAFENFNVTPDILCLAKAMGSGMPIGAFISSADNMNKLTYNPALGHITTFGGHPVSCAASLAGLNVILDEDLLSRANIAGELFESLLKPVEKIKEIRRIGLMIAIELYEECNVPDLLKTFQENGLIVDQFLFNDSSFRIAPPLIITNDEIHQIVEKIKHCIYTLN